MLRNGQKDPARWLVVVMLRVQTKLRVQGGEKHIVLHNWQHCRCGPIRQLTGNTFSAHSGIYFLTMAVLAQPGALEVVSVSQSVSQ